MDKIQKALQDLANAVESNETVKSVKVTVTLQKPKASKAKPENKQFSRQGRGESPARKSDYIIKKSFNQWVMIMLIEKYNKTYTVSEINNKWVVKSANGKVSFSVDISKDVCKTFEELKDFIKSNNEIF